jgi:hypothetical protein
MTTVWTESHSWLVVMGGFAIQNSEGHTRSVGPQSFMDLLSERAVVIPTISEGEMKEKNKGNGFIKAIAALQIIYLAMELLGRAIQHLAITTLELWTLGMVIIALGIYCFWWNKPLDVRMPIVLESNPSVVEASSKLNAMGDRLTAQALRVGFSDAEVEHFKTSYVVGAAAVTLFGACHLFGWNFEFPTHLESLLWRIASICCLSLPFLVLVFLRLPKHYHFWLVLPSSILYLIVRLYLMI